LQFIFFSSVSGTAGCIPTGIYAFLGKTSSLWFKYTYDKKRSKITVYTQHYLIRKIKLYIGRDPASFLYIRIIKTLRGMSCLKENN